MKLLKNILFYLVIFTILLVLAEEALSSFYKFPNGYFVATPNTNFIWKKNTDVIKGINKDASVYFDSFGARSTSNPSPKKKNIIAIGGSTTACFSLDQKDTWTAILEQQLGDDYWVGNFGKPGSYSTHHILQLEQLINYSNLPTIKKVIILMGKNDFSASLINEERYLKSDHFNSMINAFHHVPDSAVPWHRRLALSKLYKKARLNITQLYNRKTHGVELLESRKARSLTKEVNELPDLTRPLELYLNNAKQLIELAKANQIELVFVSQPVLWSKNLSNEDAKLICSNVQDKKIHYSAAALANGMSLFNAALSDLCDESGVQFIWSDLESNSENFIDDCHFTEAGARRVAENIYSQLSIKKPVGKLDGL